MLVLGARKGRTGSGLAELIGMRLVVGLLSLALSSSLAFAGDTPAPAPVDTAPPVAAVPRHKPSGLRIVKLLPESHQALLFDKALNKHVLVEAGQQVGAYTVEEIAPDEVTLFDQTGAELVLAAPEHRGKKAVASSEGAPADPYAEPEVRRPVTAGEGGIRVVEAGGPPPVTKPAPAMGGELDDVGFELPAAPETAPADPYESEVPPVAPASVIAPTVLSRTELNVALADFGKLSTMMRGGFTSQGLRLDAVTETSIFGKAGLRAGDVIVAVDDTKLRSLDDAAELYARASATKAANISLIRAGTSLTLRVLIH